MPEVLHKQAQEAVRNERDFANEGLPFAERILLGIAEKLRGLEGMANTAKEEERAFLSALTSLNLHEELKDAKEQLDEVLTDIHKVVKETKGEAARILLEAGLFEVFPKEPGVATFEEFSDPNFDFDTECLHREVEVVRENLMRAVLADCHSPEELRSVEEKFPLEYWGPKDFLEFSNRYRLLDSPEDEIRLFEHSSSGDFLGAPRAQEFYALALIKKNRVSDAIAVCERLIERGYGNGLVWSIRGDAMIRKVESIEKFAKAFEDAGGAIKPVDAANIEEHGAVEERLQGQEITLENVRDLELQLQREGGESYYQGLKESGSSFPALEWMFCTFKRRNDLLMKRSSFLDKQRKGGASQGEQDELIQIENEINALEQRVLNQQVLVELTLQKEGAEESLDYWKHAGRLELAFAQGKALEEIKLILAQAFKTVDAVFKIDNTLVRLTRVREQFLYERSLTQQGGEGEKIFAVKIENMNAVFEEFEKGRQRFIEERKKKGSALNEEYQAIIDASPKDDVERYKRNTINFLALLGSITPQYIPGGIGRTGARVPDLMINRQDEAVLRGIIKELGVGEESDPIILKDAIEKFVRARLGVDDLQNPKSPLHHIFDTLSDGNIALSGIKPEMRRNTRSITNLSAALLAGIGDCRETMYTMGSSFATQSRMRVEEKIREALLCLEENNQAGFEKITKEDIPEILRYELRGEHAAVYMTSVTMNEKYDVKTVSPDNPTALYRAYGMDELKRGEPLTRYELENSILRVIYTDGTIHFIEPKDPETGKWRPLEHIPQEDGEGGLPIVPNTESIATLELLNLVEDHTYSTLFDKKTGNTAFADGFYDERRGGPYEFGSGPYDLKDITQNNGLVRAGMRTLAGPNGELMKSQVYVRALRYSKTDYQPSLGEGDVPGHIRIGGRIFNVDVLEEFIRLAKGESAVPRAMQRILEWQEAHRQ